MSFKLQLTDEMIGFIRSESLSDADAGRLIKLLIDAAEERPPPETVPQPLTYTLPIFLAQIEKFRDAYNQRVASNAERQRRFQERRRNNALDALSGVSDVSNAKPDHTRPQQNKPNVPSGHSSVRNAVGRSPVGVDSYDDIWNPESNPVDLALHVCDEGNPRMAAAGFIREIRRIGDTAFRSELAVFWSELNAGENPRNRGAAFSARLKRLPNYNAAETAAAQRACAALNK